MVLSVPTVVSPTGVTLTFDLSIARSTETGCRRWIKIWASSRKKTVLGVSQKVKLKLVASLDMILSNKRMIKVLISLCGCAGWSAHLLFANPPKTGFLALRLISYNIISAHATISLHQVTVLP